MSFFQWGFLGIGGFFNVEVGDSGHFGGDPARLRPLRDPDYDDGQIWQGFRQDWVWETGVEYNHQPIRVSGVYVGGTFYPSSTTGVYKHHVNYPLGRVVFDTAISTNATVHCEHSYRQVHVTSADSAWWREVQFDSYRVDDTHFAQLGSGAWATLTENKVQLPTIVVEAVPNTSRRAKSLGSSSAIVRQDILFHVLAETPWDRKQYHDIITYQWQKRIIAFEKNWAVAGSGLPLDENGTPYDNAKMYPDMIKATGDGGFGWQQIRFEDFRSTEQPGRATAPLYVASVRATVEIDLP